MSEPADSASDAHFMRQALAQAQLAFDAGEVPVGAVLVKDGRVIAAAHNATLATRDPCGHAEILALRQAAQVLGNHRLAGCTLFVTLEPCAMCASALLQARLQRVVFGATEPKTGAAGSVLNLFANPQLNHQTHLCGGVLASDASALLQRFFAQRRAQHKHGAQPVREDAVRTPEPAFENLTDYPWPANYTSTLAPLAGLRMHYLDVAPDLAAGLVPSGVTVLCLHGNPAWSYLYRKMIPVFLAAGHRVVAPDLIGFGKSDKPKKDSFHSFEFHRNSLLALIEQLDLQRVLLVVQDWGGLLGLTLPHAMPERFESLLVMNTMLATGESLSPGFLAWREMCAKNPNFDVARLFARSDATLSAQECAAYAAPFPDAGHRAALRAFPPMVPDSVDASGAAISAQARDFFQRQGPYGARAQPDGVARGWQGRAFMAVGMQDPVLGADVMAQLHGTIVGCNPPLLVGDVGHFVQERGERVARAAVAYFAS